MIMWSISYPNYIPAPILFSSPPCYPFQLPLYAHCSYLVPLFFNTNYQYLYHYPNKNNNLEASQMNPHPRPRRQDLNPRESSRFKKWFPLRVSNPWRKRSGRSDACFRCKKRGHFAIGCPRNVMRNKSRFSSSVAVIIGQDGLQYSAPSLICHCGLCCSLTTRKRRDTTIRKCYTCSLRNCRMFKWEDEVNKDELISVPKCRCGAGFCRQLTDSRGKYFACPIKKGQGACSFFKLLTDESLINDRHVDERITPPNLTIGDFTDSFPANSVQKETRSSYVLDTAEHNPNQREISVYQKLKLMEVELEHEEDTSHRTLRKCNKRFRDGAPKYDSSFSNTVEFSNVPQSYSEGGNTAGNVHVRKSMFRRNALADWLKIAATNLNIELFKGWWGRLAYPPQPCLQLTESKPFYCCVFPSFDPISVPRIVEIVDCQSPNRHNLRQILEGSPMFEAISDQFARVARDLQYKLVSLLKSSDFHAHDYMEREANITFTALDQLQVLSKPFHEQVKKFIRSASNLNKAERSIIHNDESYNDSQDHYNSKRMKRDDLISDYGVAKAGIETCKERFHSLGEESCRQKTMLFQVVGKLSSSEAQNKHHKARCAQISMDLLELEKPLQVAEKNLQLLQQKKEEYEYDAAKVAYKKARLELLGSSPDK
ncbi:uncharacterized protein LOC108215043 isoform X2 [Daucus carota subsp. sativus]|uniref:uncharacterized protein LOC108215043 isoform X2 n=1 Tax=Daucus carota subsp. sativus TaxID=79200 RepID=UPI0007EFD2D5|nr:PREDICTED: uncharacterized protein LOC108215043 isoform X2 [Daucus carota subsp. sativus]